MQFDPTRRQKRQERLGAPAPYPGQGSRPHEQSDGSCMKRYPPQLQLLPKIPPRQASKRSPPRTQTQELPSSPGKRLNQLPISFPNRAKLPQPPVDPEEYVMLDCNMGIDNKAIKTIDSGSPTTKYISKERPESKWPKPTTSTTESSQWQCSEQETQAWYRPAAK